MSAEGLNTDSQTVNDLMEADYSGRNILVVEDYDMNMMLIKELLNMMGFEVFEAENGRIAVEKFTGSQVGFYDMVLMDIRMPEMNGYEATEAIRALDREDAKNVPIVALTANAFAEDVAKAINSGMNEHLSKPLEMGKFSEVLKKWLK